MKDQRRTPRQRDLFQVKIRKPILLKQPCAFMLLLVPKLTLLSYASISEDRDIKVQFNVLEQYTSNSSSVRSSFYHVCSAVLFIGPKPFSESSYRSPKVNKKKISA